MPPEDRWKPPIPEDMQASLERFIRHLKPIDPNYGKNRKHPAFSLAMSVEDWRNVAFAANAWVILTQSEEMRAEMQDALLLEESTQQLFKARVALETMEIHQRKAANRAASIWRT